MRQDFYKIFLIVGVLLTTLTVRSAVTLEFDGKEAASVGIYIKSLAGGEVLVDENSMIALTPASITKTITTATALNLLGKDYRFSTSVTLSGNRSSSDHTHWHGNLIITPSGDPTLESSEFKEKMGFADSIVARIARLGIKKIDGTIIIKDNMPESGPLPQWEVEDIAWPYGAGLYDFNYAGNSVRVYPNTSTTVPKSDLKIEVRTSANGSMDLLRGVNSENLIVWASAKNRTNKKWFVTASVPNPAKVFSNVLKDKLRAAGITLTDKHSKVAEASSANVYTYKSPAMTDICRSLMKRSDNLFAEGILRAFSRGQSRDKCLKKEFEFWNSQGLITKYTSIKDGSGMTRSNRVAPIFLGRLLEKMVKSEFRDIFVDFFPVSGVDGTLKTFLEDTRLKGNLALKTGSMSGVQTYAGYKLDDDGNPTHVVVIMVNGFSCSRSSLRKSIETFLLSLFN